jgi:PAS domain S-box-containing protein
MPDSAIFMIGPQGMVLTWNEGATRIFGHRPHEIIGQRFSRLYPRTAVAAGEPARDLDRARAGERYDGEGWRVRKDGAAFWASVVITELRDREGRPRGFGVVVRDLTDRRRADDLLAVLDAAVDPMLGIADDGRIIFGNTAAQQAFGYPAGEIVGLPLQQLLPAMADEPDRPSPDRPSPDRPSPDESGLGPALPGPRLSREAWHEPKLTVSGLELDAVRRDGSAFLAEVSLAAVRTARGGVVTATVRDLGAGGETLGWRNRPGTQVSAVVRAFVCDVCGAGIAFENVTCLTCGSPLAYSPAARRVVVVLADAEGNPENRHEAGGMAERPCANAVLAGCNWLASEDAANGLCLSCRLTRTRPNDADTQARGPFVRAEAAKRRLVYQLLDLGLPVVAWMDDARNGLAVDLLSSREQPVVTGHAHGVITLDLAEGDDPHRESVRVSPHEACRTLLGRLRHETGHYYWRSLAGRADQVEQFRELFGDERADYQAAVDRAYQEGPPPGWEQDYVSSCATMHPWEDWAETFAHYLHMRDLLQTAQAFGLAVRRRVEDGAGAGELDTLADLDAVGAEEDVAQLVNRWLPLSYGLNAVNRSMGKPDLYPFVLTPVVIAKLNAVHHAVHRAVAGQQPVTA